METGLEDDSDLMDNSTQVSEISGNQDFPGPTGYIDLERLSLEEAIAIEDGLGYGGKFKSRRFPRIEIVTVQIGDWDVELHVDVDKQAALAKQAALGESEGKTVDCGGVAVPQEIVDMVNTYKGKQDNFAVIFDKETDGSGYDKYITAKLGRNGRIPFYG